MSQLHSAVLLRHAEVVLLLSGSSAILSVVGCDVTVVSAALQSLGYVAAALMWCWAVAAIVLIALAAVGTSTCGAFS